MGRNAAAERTGRPLLAFRSQLETGEREHFLETVNVVPVFTAAAPVWRMLSSSRAKRDELAVLVPITLVEQRSRLGWSEFLRACKPPGGQHAVLQVPPCGRLWCR